MNRFITLLAISLSLILNSSTLSAIKVNGKETSGEFTYENPAGTKHVAFKFDATGITVGSLGGIDQKVAQMQKRFAELKPQLGCFSAGQALNMTCPSIQGQLLQGQSVALKGAPGLSLESCIVESPSAVFTANNIKFADSFVQSANPFRLVPENGTPVVKEVKLFPIAGNSPMFVQGDLNFATFRTGEFFVVTGTRKVWMKL